MFERAAQHRQTLFKLADAIVQFELRGHAVIALRGDAPHGAKTLALRLRYALAAREIQHPRIDAQDKFAGWRVSAPRVRGLAHRGLRGAVSIVTRGFGPDMACGRSGAAGTRGRGRLPRHLRAEIVTALACVGVRAGR